MYLMDFFSNAMIISMYYCVLDKILFSNCIFTVTPNTMIFLFFIVLPNVCILIYLSHIINIFIKFISFNGSIAVFQVLQLKYSFSGNQMKPTATLEQVSKKDCLGNC